MSVKKEQAEAQAENQQNEDVLAEEVENQRESANEYAEDVTEETAEEAQTLSLAEELQQSQAKADENWDHYLRAKAEMDNLRRRNTKDVENAHKYGIEKLATELLPILDSMTLGLASEDADAKSLREGMGLTMNMLEKMLEKLNIEEVDPLNEKFDAEKHQAMGLQPSDEVEPNTVIAVMQKGYLLNQRLLRPAMVMVSKAVE